MVKRPVQPLGSNKLKPQVNEIKQLQAALKREQRKVVQLKKKLDLQKSDFRTVAENAPDVICRFDRRHRHLYVNPALEKATGAPHHAFIGRTPHEAGLPQEFADFWVHHISQVFEKPELTVLEFSFPSPMGEKHYQAILVPEFSQNGQPETVLSMTRDITEMKMQQDLKDKFLAMVSHELKTPITSLKMYTQLVHRQLEKTNDKKCLPYVKKMDTAVDFLTKLIDDLLDATRIGSGKMTYRQVNFDFNVLVQEVVTDMQLAIQTHNFLLNHNEAPLLVTGDRGRMYQVLVNLLSNAIKYSPIQSTIVITVEHNHKQLICKVQDSGIGIPHDKLKQIFDQFFRVDEDAHQQRPGIGLGLYIASEIIRNHGGKIWVESEPGNGSTFYFSLPLQLKKEQKL